MSLISSSRRWGDCRVGGLHEMYSETLSQKSRSSVPFLLFLGDVYWLYSISLSRTLGAKILPFRGFFSLEILRCICVYVMVWDPSKHEILLF